MVHFKNIAVSYQQPILYFTTLYFKKFIFSVNFNVIYYFKVFLGGQILIVIYIILEKHVNNTARHI